ncbi:MAG TPA: ABC transporter substrate-binding protein [Streptosporangiaceae bacterium]|nr:ABC transporter substrate-binding protein [Streptosporangiaceae bacterium]
MRTLTRRLPVLAALLALAGSAAACGSTPASTTGANNTSATTAASGTGGTAASTFPVSIAAANGTVRVGSRPAAILSLSPTATEMLYAIGAGSQVKAVDSDSDYPPQAPHTKLSAYQPNAEAIVAYKPDLVVESGDTGQLTKRLAAFSVPVLELPAPSNVAGEYAEFTELGRATGHLAQAQQEVARLRAQLRQISAAAPHHAGPLTYYYELDQTYYSVTSSTFVGQLLSLLGMKSIADKAAGAASAGGYPQLSAEYIIKANPDYIILADTICCQQSAATIAKRPGWSGLTAVKRGHVIGLNDDIASRWGPRITSLLRAVETAIAKGTSR